MRIIKENENENNFTLLIYLMSSSRFSLMNPVNNPTQYPSSKNHRALHYITMFDTTLLPYNVTVPAHFTVSKGTFIYKPHADVGMVGRSAAGYLAQRKRM